MCLGNVFQHLRSDFLLVREGWCGGVNLADCAYRPCVAGFSSDSNSSACYSCTPGKYSQLGFDACRLCEAGSFGVEFNATTCSPCSAGNFSAALGASSPETCVSCPQGFFSSAGSSFCSACAIGKFSTQVGAAYCMNCAAGKTSAGGSTTCTACAVGKYSTGVGGDCSLCGIGKYTTVTGSTSSSQCNTCPVGTYSLAGSSTCISCVEGKVVADSKTGCVDCNVLAKDVVWKKPGEDCSWRCADSSFMWVRDQYFVQCVPCPGNALRPVYLVPQPVSVQCVAVELGIPQRPCSRSGRLLPTTLLAGAARLPTSTAPAADAATAGSPTTIRQICLCVDGSRSWSKSLRMLYYMYYMLSHTFPPSLHDHALVSRCQQSDGDGGKPLVNTLSRIQRSLSIIEGCKRHISFRSL
eukprot:755102-Hanusia_phi.AAC.5